MSSPRLLSNRYELGETLGYGGMSEVHSGRDVRLGRDVAVKVLRADLASDPTFQLRFRREAQNAAALNHPAIVAVYDTGETDSDSGALPYIVMEYVHGRTLRDIVKTEGPLVPRRAMEVMADASAALDFSHRHGIVHRDVKPANIMITDSGAVKVMDFGIARAVADGQAAVTQTAAVIGTAQYLSPEQARGETVDARSDVYAAGCVLFELLTGQPPFTGDSPVAVAYQHVREEPSKPSDHNEQVPASLDAVVLKALSKNPANRYESAADMRTDLIRVLSGQRPNAPMVMSAEERTAMMGGSSATQVAETRQHWPEEVARPDEEDLEQVHRRKRRKRWVIGLVTAVCLGVFALAAWLATIMTAEPSGPKQITLGNYVGQEIAVARNSAAEAGFQVMIREQPSSPADEGRVVRQKPPANRQYAIGTQVYLFKGTGPKQVDVPDLTGMTMSEAQKALRGVGLALNFTPKETEVTDSDKVGTILSQSETGSVDQGTMITVTVGKAIEKKSVPDVGGQSLADATSTLESAGFTVTSKEVDSPKPAGTVISQNPSAGSSVRPGSEITLSVSNGSQITVPDLTGLSESEAEDALEQAGWNGDLSTRKQATNDESMDDKVVGSSPAAGSAIGKDQPITLYIGDYGASPSSSQGGLFPSFG
ncbi:Stk1 family PASTA domain-containing Ser/Thr kinase [Halopolyspora algeriensis]|nr:Stk1 family PASTA domain-containing Ser/Thr kinase [Halopolyspora algeriensis]